MKKIKKTVLYLLGFAALLLITTLVINLPAFDEELLPEVVAIKNIQAEPFSEDNAFPALIAINSASGPSLKSATKTVREFLNQKIADSGLDYLSDEEEAQLIGAGHDSSWKNLYTACSSRKDKNCMITLTSEVLDKPINDARLMAQLQRYSALIEYNEFHEATQMSFDSPMISLSSTLSLKRLFLTDAYINDSNQDYLLKWKKDTQFWRMVAANSHMLITRMVAIASITISIDSLSAAIRNGSLNANQLRQMQAEINTLTAAEIDMGITFEFEYKYGTKMYDGMYEKGEINSDFESLFYQHQATNNMHYLYMTQAMKKISALNTAEFYQYVEERHTADIKSPFSWSPKTLYNPVGKLLIGYSIPAYTDYIGRAHDLNGMFYLLKLQIEIALNPEEPVQQVISQSQYTNPYTLEPMSYNQDAHSIYFKCMDKTSVCELDL